MIVAQIAGSPEKANVSAVVESSLPREANDNANDIKKLMEEKDARLELELKLLTALVLVLLFVAFKVWQRQRIRKG